MSRLLLAALLLTGGCAAEQSADSAGFRGPEPLRTGQEQIDRLCGRASRDLVTDLICDGAEVDIRSFQDLRAALGFGSNNNDLDEGFALSGHSTSLVRRSVSAINPRAIFVRPGSEEAELAALAFARGEQFSEVAVRNRLDGQLQFYLVKFSLPCEETPEGCAPGDLLTEAVESGWTDVNIYGEEDLENTPLDCRVCHQVDGPGSRKILRMQELEPPWNHWLYRLSRGGRALLDDYYAAKGDEAYAGLGEADIFLSQPGLLSAALFFAGSAPQPNAFVSRQIEAEVVRSAAEKGGNQPVDNSVPGDSETWREIYERSKRGDAIAVPYHDVKVTDPDKLAMMTQAYTDYRAGLLSRGDLPDIRDVFPDDVELRARMGLATEPGMSGEQVLMQACAQCHNDRLDQTLTRARFNVDLSRMDRQAKDRAIQRIQLPPDDPAVMPPTVIRSLSDEGRERLIELLEE